MQWAKLGAALSVGNHAPILCRLVACAVKVEYILRIESTHDYTVATPLLHQVRGDFGGWLRPGSKLIYDGAIIYGGAMAMVIGAACTDKLALKTAHMTCPIGSYMHAVT